MQFSHPFFLYLALVLALLMPAAGLLARWRRRRELRAFAVPEAVARLTAHWSADRRILKTLTFMLGLFLLAFALAGPQWGSKMVEIHQRGQDVIIALDVSKSMLAEDIKPNRLQRAQQELNALIDQLHGDRIGVIAFAGSAQVACPLTTDYTAAKMFLSYLTPASVPIPGTSLGGAVRLALETFPKNSEGFRTLVLLTDGEDHHSEPLEAARAAKAAGVKILALGFGTPEGEPIPLREAGGRVTGYLKNERGESVVSHLDETTLKEMAQITGGAYWPSRTGSLEADRLAEIIQRMQKREISSGRYGVQEDRFQFLLLPALLLLLFSFWLPQRKRAWLLLLPFLCLAAIPAYAGAGADVNRGNRAYGKKQYQQALQKYRDAQIQDPGSPVVQYDLGNAYHRLEKYPEAQKAYREALRTKDRGLRAKAWYNLGNTLFQQKEYAQALEYYAQALKLKPHDPDVLNNLALALRMVKEPQNRQKQSEKQKGSKKNQQPSQAEQSQEQQQGSGQKNPSRAGGRPRGPDDRGEKAAGESAQQETPREKAAGRAPRPGEMSPEDAKNLLEAVRESEQEAQQKRLEEMNRRQGQRSVKENW